MEGMVSIATFYDPDGNAIMIAEDLSRSAEAHQTTGLYWEEILKIPLISVKRHLNQDIREFSAIDRRQCAM